MPLLRVGSEVMRQPPPATPPNFEAPGRVSSSPDRPRFSGESGRRDRPRALVIGLLLALSMATGGVGRAQGFEGARLIGFGGAQAALANTNDAIYVNPAGLAFGATYSLELGYLDNFRNTDRRFNASIADSQAGPVAGGLAYTYTNRAPDAYRPDIEDLHGHRFDLALATLASEVLAIGISGRYLTFDREGGNAPPGAGFKLFTFDAGIQWRLGAGLSLGVAGYNLTNPSEVEAPISVGGGLGWQFSLLSLEGDARFNVQQSKWYFAGAAGLALADTFAVRAAISHDDIDDSLSISGGAGLVFQSLSLDVAYRQQVNAVRTPGMEHPRIMGVAARFGFF